MAQTILIVDDDPQIRDLLRMTLEGAGYACATVADGARALVEAARLSPALIVLDIGLPEMDGLEVCRRLRATSEVPVLFLTARDDEIDRVLGLEMGADDYVTKPFSPRELVARIKAILKRSAPGGGFAGGALAQGVLRLDPAAHACDVAGTPVVLTGREMAILQTLMARPSQVITRTQLRDQVYGATVHVADRTLDSHLRNLRAKLTEAGCADALETVHGVGLRMGPCSGA